VPGVTAIFLEGTLSRIGTLLLGAILGVLLDHLLSPSLNKWRERRSAERARRHRRSFDYAGRPLEFDGVDVGVEVLFGTLGRATKPEDVRATLNERKWVSPARLRSAAERYGEHFGFYDGLVARLNKLDVEVYTDARGGERHRLLLEVMPTGYYDFLATNVGLGPFTPATARLLRGRGGLAETQLSNMMALDLTLVTVDGYAPVCLRSARMAGLERCWQASSGETVQLQVDVDTDGSPDLFATARRGLKEELGVSPEMLDELAVTAFVATPEYANIGVLMYATIPLTAEKFERQLNRHVMSARDNWEYTNHSLLAIDDAQQLAVALTDPSRRWSKQAAASIVFAHAFRTGNIEPLTEAIRAAGSLSLEPGPRHRSVLSSEDLPSHGRRYCWRCGSALKESLPTICDTCSQAHYDNPKPCGEAVVVRDGRILMLRRAQSPWKGHWDLPGGFCDQGEHPMHATERELKEELGLSGKAVAYLGTWMDTYGPPAVDGIIDQTANSAYLIELDDSNISFVLEQNEVLDAQWFPLDKPPDSLAFPVHVERVLSVARKLAAESLPRAELPDRDW